MTHANPEHQVNIHFLSETSSETEGRKRIPKEAFVLVLFPVTVIKYPQKSNLIEESVNFSSQFML